MTLELAPTILFDLDGTILDSLPGIEFSVRQAFSACGLPLQTNSVRELIGPPIRTILSRAGNIAEPATLDRLEYEFRASYDCDGWRKSSCFSDAGLVLKQIQVLGCRVLLLSNKPRHVSLQILKQQGILKYFEAVVTRDSRFPNYAGKHEMIEAVVRERSLAHDKCVLVGDTLEDANAAAAAQIRFVLMTHGYGVLSQMSSVPIWRKFDNFSQFLSSMMKEIVID
jgi:phosphoglycolate phosphatase